MASASSAIILKLLSAATDHKSRHMLITILLIPLGFIVVILSMFTFKTDDANNPYNKAVAQVKEESHISNTLDGNLVRCVYMAMHGDITEDVEEISNLIRENFIKEITESYIGEDGAEYTVTYNAFMAYFEILELLPLPPFSLESDAIELVMLYALLSPGELEGDISVALKFPRPCNGYVSSAYGGRVNPITGEPGAFHYGMDIRGEHYQPIKSIADGTVRIANTSKSGYGNYILIEHNLEGVKFYSLYAHLSSLSVSFGQDVHQGQIIGNEGGEPNVDNNAGDSTGHHLHFEIRKTASRDSVIDPAPYIS